MSRLLVAVVAFAVFSGCDPGGGPAPSRAPEDAATPYRPVADVRQTMEWILDPAADAIWDSAGFIITAEGETDLAPTTAEGWERVRRGATVVAETGNLLMMPGRSAGREWVSYSQALTAAGEFALAAADARDADALFEAGGQVYQACRACHDQYMVPAQDARPAE